MNPLPQENTPPKISGRSAVFALLIILTGFVVYQYVYSEPQLALIGSTAVVGEVTMTLQASSATVPVGGQFTVDVILNAGVNRVSASELSLVFPPQLQATSIVPGSFLPVNLLPGTVVSGRASITVGSQVQASPAPQGVDGSGIIAKATFVASQAGTFKIQIDPATQVAVLGQVANVLTTRTPVSITVNGPTPTPTASPTPTVLPTVTSSPVVTLTPIPTLSIIPLPVPNPTQDPNIISFGSLWKYLDTGSNQGVLWRSSAFNDSGWATGQAQLGYGEGDEATVVRYGHTSSQKYVTTYFRKKITVSSPSTFSSLVLKVLKDDGAVVYINGTQVARINIPKNFGYTTFATTGKENSVTSHTLSASLLVPGTNVIAVEVHQAGRTSSDLSFDLSLTGN